MRGSWGLRGTSESPFWGEGAGSRPKPATRGDGELNFDGSSGGWERWKLILEEPASGPAIAVDSFGSFFPSSSSNGLPSLDYWRSDLGLQFAFQIVPSRDPRAYYTSLTLTPASLPSISERAARHGPLAALPCASPSEHLIHANGTTH
jgi:hypothetical protein